MSLRFKRSGLPRKISETWRHKLRVSAQVKDHPLLFSKTATKLRVQSLYNTMPCYGNTITGRRRMQRLVFFRSRREGGSVTRSTTLPRCREMAGRRVLGVRPPHASTLCFHKCTNHIPHISIFTNRRSFLFPPTTRTARRLYLPQHAPTYSLMR